MNSLALLVLAAAGSMTVGCAQQLASQPIEAAPGPADRVVEQQRPRIAEHIGTVDPRPLRDPRTWITAADYPSASIKANEEGLVVYVLDVDADGQVYDCRILISSGHSRLDSETCRLAASRARFRPAVRAGNPTSGSYSYYFRWRIAR